MRKSLFSAALLLAASAFAQQPITGFSAKAAQEQAALEAKFDAQLSAQRIGQYIKDMSSRPHHVGSPGGEAVAQSHYVRDESANRILISNALWLCLDQHDR